MRPGSGLAKSIQNEMQEFSGLLSYRPVSKELGTQCNPSIAGLSCLFDGFVSFFPRPWLQECFLEINLGGMHLLKCLGEGVHVFRRHSGFGHGSMLESSNKNTTSFLRPAVCRERGTDGLSE